MSQSPFSHLIEIDEQERLLTIYRISDKDRQLYTSVKLPEKDWSQDQDAIREFCRKLGESILVDSPTARRVLKI